MGLGIWGFFNEVGEVGCLFLQSFFGSCADVCVCALVVACVSQCLIYCLVPFVRWCARLLLLSFVFSIA